MHQYIQYTNKIQHSSKQFHTWWKYNNISLDICILAEETFQPPANQRWANQAELEKVTHYWLQYMFTPRCVEGRAREGVREGQEVWRGRKWEDWAREGYTWGRTGVRKHKRYKGDAGVRTGWGKVWWRGQGERWAREVWGRGMRCERGGQERC